eukprot:3409154-Prymnesium_polylepis.1
MATTHPWVALQWCRAAACQAAAPRVESIEAGLSARAGRKQGCCCDVSEWCALSVRHTLTYHV